MTVYTWLVARWQGLFLAGVFVLSTAALTRVTVAGEQAPFMLIEAAYHTMALFVVSSPGFPESGGAAWIVVCWACHFLAPLATASVLAEGVQRLRSALVGPSVVVGKMRDHTILCGFGNHGYRLAEVFIENHPTTGLVIIDRDPDMPDFVEIRGRQVPVVRGDLATHASTALQAAGIERAGSLLAVTGNDLLNLSLCAMAQAWTERELHLLALVADEGLAKNVQSLFNPGRAILVNTYQACADRLLGEGLTSLAGGFDPAERDLIVVGCGRFGAMVVRTAVQRWSAVRRPWIVVVDLCADERLATHPALDDLPAGVVVGVNGNARSEAVMRRAVEACTGGAEPLVLLCTDDDIGNLATAMRLRSCLKGEIGVLIRMFAAPSDDLTAELKTQGIQCFGLRELLAESLPEWLTGPSGGA